MKASSVSSRLPRRLRRMAALVGAAALCGALALALAGCAGGSAGGATGAGGLGGTDAGDSGASASGPISVYSREDGSGTRGAFVELLGIEQADANGDKVDMTTSDGRHHQLHGRHDDVGGRRPQCHRLHLAWLAGRYGEGGVHRRRCAFGCGCEGRFLRHRPALQRGDQGGSVRARPPISSRSS